MWDSDYKEFLENLRSSLFLELHFDSFRTPLSILFLKKLFSDTLTHVQSKSIVRNLTKNWKIEKRIYQYSAEIMQSILVELYIINKRGQQALGRNRKVSYLKCEKNFEMNDSKI
jgi:hypothetical protein